MALQKINGVELHIEDTGPRDAPAIVFGHGLLFSGLMFQGQIDALSENYRCVTIDWRGQGRSPQADGGYDMDTLATDAVAVIESLGAGPVHYVGLSMGGFVGLRVAARDPELLRSLTLLDTSAGPEDPANVSKYRLLARIYRLVGMKPLKGQVAPIMFGPKFLADPSSAEPVAEWMRVLGAVQRKGMQQAIYGVTDREPVFDELPAIKAPTLVVVGADDVATPVTKAETLHHQISGSRLEIVPDCGHSSTIEKPAELARLIAAHISANN